MTYEWSTMKTQDLLASDLDLKWTAQPILAGVGPRTDLTWTSHTHTGEMASHLPRARSTRLFDCCCSTTTFDFPIRMVTTPPGRELGGCEEVGEGALRSRVRAHDLDDLRLVPLTGLHALALNPPREFFLAPQ